MIVLAYDHGAREMFGQIKEYLKEQNLEYVECASMEYDAMDSFVDFAKGANEYVRQGYIGIYGCRSGIGMSMAANRAMGVRAALCVEPKFAEMSRKHNNANVCVLPCDYIDFEKVKSIIQTFLKTEFLGGKYELRNNQLDDIR
jgi:ribose 5-phosphate isomerase B